MPADPPPIEPTRPLTHNGPHPAPHGESFELPLTIFTLVGSIVALLAVATAGGGTALLVLAVVVMLAGAGWILALMARLLDG